MKRQLSLISISVTMLCFVAAVSGRVFTGPVASNIGPINAITGFIRRINLSAVSPEGCPLTYAIASGPTHGTVSQLNTLTGLALYTSSSGFSGNDSFTYTATANTTGSCTATPVTSSAATVSITVGNTRTTINGQIPNPDGSPAVGQVVWTLVQGAATFDGFYIVNGSSVTRTLDNTGSYTVSLYATSGLSPNTFYMLKLVQGASSTLIGYYNIPASGSAISQAILNTNQIWSLNGAQINIATADEVEALANQVQAITLNHSLLGSIHNDTVPASPTRGAIIVGNSTPKWAAVPRGASGTYVRTDGTDTGFSAIQDADLPSTLAGKTLTSPTINNGTSNTPTINNPTINGATLSGSIGGTSTISGATLTSPIINGGTLNGTFSGTPVINCSNCTGIGTSGGLINAGSTTIGADSGGLGSGIIDFQTHNGISRFQIQNNGTLTFMNEFDLKAKSAPTLSSAGFARFYYDSSLHQVMLSTEGGAFAAITASPVATALRYDVQRDFGASGSDQQTTGSITGSTSTLTLANAKDFINGDGIMIAGAGTSGHNCISTVQSGGGTTTITLATTCPTTVSGAAVKHDDSAAINTALATVAAAGGGNILFKMKDRNGLAGKYHVAGALQSNCNSILCFAQIARTNNPVIIGIIGEAVADWTGSSVVPTNGTVIDGSDFNDSTPSNFAAIASTKTYNPSTGTITNTTFNYSETRIENITIRNKPNPALSGINIGNGEGLIMNHVLIDAGEALTFTTASGFNTLTQPTNTNAVGVITPNINNSSSVLLNHVTVIGYNEGYRLSDNARLSGVYAIGDSTGLQFHDNAAMISGWMGIYLCPNPLVYSADAGLGESISNLQVEIQNETSSGTWYDVASNHTVYDPNGYATGTLNAIISGNTGYTFPSSGRHLSIIENTTATVTYATPNQAMTLQQTVNSAPTTGPQLTIANQGSDRLFGFVPGSAYGVSDQQRNGILGADRELWLTSGNTFPVRVRVGSFNSSNEILNMSQFFGTFKSTFLGIVSIQVPQHPPNTPSQISADQNNYAPGSGGFQRWSSNASHNVTGLNAGQDGESMEIWNVGSSDIVLQNENVSSTATNRFHNSTGADITLSAGQVAFARYDATTGRWRVSKGN